MLSLQQLRFLFIVLMLWDSLISWLYSTVIEHTLTTIAYQVNTGMRKSKYATSSSSLCRVGPIFYTTSICCFSVLCFGNFLTSQLSTSKFCRRFKRHLKVHASAGILLLSGHRHAHIRPCLAVSDILFYNKHYCLTSDKRLVS